MISMGMVTLIRFSLLEIQRLYFNFFDNGRRAFLAVHGCSTQHFDPLLQKYGGDMAALAKVICYVVATHFTSSSKPPTWLPTILLHPTLETPAVTNYKTICPAQCGAMGASHQAAT